MSADLSRRLFLATAPVAAVFGALSAAKVSAAPILNAIATPALPPLTAAEYVQILRGLGNTVALSPSGALYIMNFNGLRTPPYHGEFDARLGLWEDACRDRGYRYSDEVHAYLEAEEVAR